MEDAYATALNNKNAEAVVVYYADDAVSLSYNEPMLVGKAAILEDTRKQMAKDTSGATIKFEVVDVFAAGDLAVEVGKSIKTLPSGKIKTGKYISTFEKRGGKYICIRDIWNNDAPEAPNNAKPENN